VADVLKTWPAFMTSRHTLEVMGHPFARFYFALGRGKPQQAIERLFFTHRGRIIGSFQVEELRKHDGTNIPRLTSLEGGESEWQIKPDMWVAICAGPMQRLKEKLYHDGFRGWRYFDLDEYRASGDAKRRWSA
jgi:hypothetical protein